MVDCNGSRSHVHANKIRKFHVRVDEVSYDSVLFYNNNNCECADDNDTDTLNCQCANVYERDDDFSKLCVLESSNDDVENQVVTEPPPRSKIDPSALSHQSPRQRDELLNVLDQFPECFSETPGLCNLVEHEIPVTEEFRLKRLKAYRVPKNLKAEVNSQINTLLSRGFIKPSKSPMPSPVVCVLKGKDGKGGVRLAVNYQYLNKYTVPDVLPLPDIAQVIQKVGAYRYISLFDATSGYHQCSIRPQDQWLSAFVCDDGLYEWTRIPFRMRSSGSTFVRAVKEIIEPVKEFTEAYVDDMAIDSNSWSQHLECVKQFLSEIRASGITLNVQKCTFAKSDVKFVGHLIGSGRRRADPEKVSTVYALRAAETKKQLRQILGFFSFFRDYIPQFAEVARPLTDLTAKHVPNRIPWGESQQLTLDKLKELLVNATINPLYIVNMCKPFTIHVDASDYAAGGTLTQTMENGTEKPIAFASCKFNATLEKLDNYRKGSQCSLGSTEVRALDLRENCDRIH